MEQNSYNQVISNWLANYSLFICDRFGLPHHRSEELLQEYLNITARNASHQPTALSNEQPTSYPEVPSPHQATHNREQPPSSQPSTSLQTLSSSHSQVSTPYHQRYLWDRPSTSHPPADLQTPPLNHSEVSNPYRETHGGEEPAHPSNFTATTIPNTTNHGSYPPDNPQLGRNIPGNLETSETGALPPLPTPAVNQTPIGDIHQYDPHWVQHSEDVTAVEKFKSRMKFDTLFHAGVINVGDVLTFEVTVPGNGRPSKTEAHLTIIGSSRPPDRPGNFPDLSITLLSNPTMRYPVAKACTGTMAIIEHLETCNITVTDSHWRDIQVFRGQQDLGSLWWVKQAFHLWRDRKDQEAQATGQHFRRRHARGSGKDAVRYYQGLFGVWQGERFVPYEDQSGFRARG